MASTRKTMLNQYRKPVGQVNLGFFLLEQDQLSYTVHTETMTNIA